MFWWLQWFWRWNSARSGTKNNSVLSLFSLELICSSNLIYWICYFFQCGAIKGNVVKQGFLQKKVNCTSCQHSYSYVEQLFGMTILTIFFCQSTILVKCLQTLCTLHFARHYIDVDSCKLKSLLLHWGVRGLGKSNINHFPIQCVVKQMAFQVCQVSKGRLARTVGKVFKVRYILA